jgi:hypothetical protein
MTPTAPADAIAHGHLHTLLFHNQTTDPIDHEHVGETPPFLNKVSGGKGLEVCLVR